MTTFLARRRRFSHSESGLSLVCKNQFLHNKSMDLKYWSWPAVALCILLNVFGFYWLSVLLLSIISFLFGWVSLSMVWAQLFLFHLATCLGIEVISFIVILNVNKDKYACIFWFILSEGKQIESIRFEWIQFVFVLYNTIPCSFYFQGASDNLFTTFQRNWTIKSNGTGKRSSQIAWIEFRYKLNSF